MAVRVFIGSSSESYEAYALKARDELTKYGVECVTWKELFELNVSTYDNLIRAAITFDYAVFVGAQDDLVCRVAGETEYRFAVRDNVYFELGLYTGILSSSRAFFLIHNDFVKAKDGRMASDFNGIYHSVYKDKKEEADSFEKACKRIIDRIKSEDDDLARYGQLPTTSLAYGYVDHFLRHIIDDVARLKCVYHGWKRYKINSNELEIAIVLPDDLQTGWGPWVDDYERKHQIIKRSVSGKNRKFSIKLDVSALEKGKLRVVDYPFTLRSAFRAVDKILQVSGEGSDEKTRQAYEKAARDFVKTVRIIADRENKPVASSLRFYRGNELLQIKKTEKTGVTV